MNILCQSTFLAEGLQALGHTVLPFPKDGTSATLADIVRTPGQKPDLVLLQLWGHTPLPADIAHYDGPVVAHAVDSSLNEFWLESMGRLVSVLFVDQLSSVPRLRARGVNAHWLPLCAQQGYFRDSTPKKYGISFVGRVTEQREKRRNLLRLVEQHFDLARFSDVSMQEMQDICAASHIVLNENLFDGTTLRVFQGLASGSLVLTEAAGHGVSRLFRAHNHLVTFDAHNVLERIETCLRDTETTQAIARAGQELCRAQHTSQARAEQLLALLRSPAAQQPMPSDETTRVFYEAKALFYRTRRHGGNASPCLSVFRNIANGTHALRGEACTLLGDVAMRRNRKEEALDYYTAAANLGSCVESWGRLAFFHAVSEQLPQARAALARALTFLPELARRGGLQRVQQLADLARNLDSLDSPAAVVLALAQLARAQGRLCHMGFSRQDQEQAPEVALELALHAHSLAPSQGALALALECADAFGMAGELLPTMLEAIRQGLLDDAMIARTAELATDYYDFELAHSLARSLGRRLR